MAKSSAKSKGTGRQRPQRKRDEAKAERQTKKQIAISRKQAEQNRIIWISVGVLALIILIVLTIGVVRELIIKPGQPVAIVNGTKVRSDDFQSLLNYRRNNALLTIQNLQSELDSLDPSDENNQFLASFYEQQLQQLQANLALAPQNTLEELIEDTLILEKAQELGIVVTDDQVAQTIDEDLRLAAEPPSQTTSITDTVALETPTPVPQEQLDEIYQNALTNLGLSDGEFRAIVQRSLYRSELQDLLASQVSTTGLVANVQLIKTDSQEQASAALQRIESGEDFSVVATEVSTDTLTAPDGGTVGWVTTGQLSTRYGDEVETSAFSAEIGQIVLVESGGSFYLILVSERDENGPLPESIVTSRQNAALDDWLAEAMASPDVEIERLLDSDQVPIESIGGQ